MAIAYSFVKHGVAGNMRVNVVDVALDATYGAGGYALTPASLGVSTIHMLIPQFVTAEGLLAKWDEANGKLQVFKGAATVTVTTGLAAFTEAAVNDTLVSATTIVRCLVIGDAPSG